ncbi:hypothetical protein RDI58_004935 [Solanum bulbocastanum]|uniref:Uncharacterized protein n=1 Tax=Solanum bulbocastanum TaxID=147425 RepID=A0AAN8YQH6_SOLBU
MIGTKPAPLHLSWHLSVPKDQMLLIPTFSSRI